MEKLKRILIADDEPGIRNVMREILRSMDYEVETAADGYEALAKLELDIDLVITDAMMPGMDGFEVVRRIRADSRFDHLPVIMVTGSTDVGDRVRAAEAGVTDFITKPVDYTELRLRTKTLLRMKEMYDAMKSHKAELELTVSRRTESLRIALEQLVAQQRTLREANLESIQRLVAATEYKERGTAAHIRRIGHFSSIIARKIKLSPSDVELIHYASPMHDIGKIGTPESILMKPSSLDEAEWVVMRQHTNIGADILRDSSFELLQMGERIAISHHEKWDGTGYPNKLSGEAIPIEGRICAVVDVFDALTSKRPYKEAYTVEASLKIIQDESGRHFDPQMVDALIGSMTEVMEVKEKVKG